MLADIYGNLNIQISRGRRGRDSIVVGLTPTVESVSITTKVVSSKSRSWLGLLDTT